MILDELEGNINAEFLDATLSEQRIRELFDAFEQAHPFIVEDPVEAWGRTMERAERAEAELSQARAALTAFHDSPAGDANVLSMKLEQAEAELAAERQKRCGTCKDYEDCRIEDLIRTIQKAENNIHDAGCTEWEARNDN